MNRWVVYTVAAAIAGLPAVGAAKNADGFLNGKPFAALNEKIEANSSELSALSGSLAALKAECEVTEADVDAIKAEVDANSEGLAALSASVDANFAALTAQYIEDIGSVNDLIAALQLQVDGLTAQAGTLADSLGDAIASLDATSGTVDALVIEVLGINATLTSVNASINGLNNDIDELQAQLDEQAALIAQIELQGTAVSAAAFSGVASITFETLNTDCDTSQPNTFQWRVNDVEVATSVGDDAGTCSCNAPVTTTIADESILASISYGADGDNTLEFQRVENNMMHAVAWSRAVLEDSAGNSRVYCIFDHAGGDCTETNLCAASYTFGAADGSTTF